MRKKIAKKRTVNLAEGENLKLCVNVSRGDSYLPYLVEIDIQTGKVKNFDSPSPRSVTVKFPDQDFTRIKQNKGDVKIIPGCYPILCG